MLALNEEKIMFANLDYALGIKNLLLNYSSSDNIALFVEK